MIQFYFKTCSLNIPLTGYSLLNSLVFGESIMPASDRQIDRLVHQLYDLTEDGMKLVEGVG